MTRPFLSRVLPNRLKEKVYYAYFHERHRRWAPLFESAPLVVCPDVKMYELIPGDVISGNIAFHGFYEWELTRRLANAARAGGCFVDVGANMGYFSLAWAGLNPTAKVYAFEPSPRNVRLIENNVARNGFANRVIIIPKAAGDASGSIAFDVGPGDQTGWGHIADGNSRTTITVPVVRLDEELADREIAVLKIDTEGADTLVLKGAAGLLKRQRIHTIFFEEHPSMEQFGIAHGTAQAWLKSFGYDCTLIDDSEWMAVRSAVSEQSDESRLTGDVLRQASAAA